VPAHHRRLTTSELVAIELLARALAQPRAKGVVLGIGDDAAVLENGLVWTIDAAVEGVHFDRRWVTLEDIGARAVEAALSDLAAMGATPIAALSALTLPRGIQRREIVALGKGEARAAKRAHTPIVGGNIARGPVLSLTTTVLGRARRPLRRDGARPGDELWLVGKLGLARAGLSFLQKSGKGPRQALRAWQRPHALLDEGRKLVGRASACIDVSDGLAGDAWHLAERSRVRVVIEGDAIVDPMLRAVARALARSPIELALQGGEDYALLATGPRQKRPRFARKIGGIEAGRGVLLELAGKRRVLPRQGFDHLT
jgi:thiamine-monophosphate kinase